MTPKKPRKFNRPLVDSRSYHPLFVIVPEGSKTERDYFDAVKMRLTSVVLKIISSSHSSPPYLLKTMRDCLKKYQLKEHDEAWIVLDKDRWSDEQLEKLHNWSQQNARYGLALSNPCFEYWLLLHFEKGNAAKQDVKSCLKEHLPDYDKGISPNKITHEQVRKAVKRARERDKPPCCDWPRCCNQTTVYRLVEKILLAEEEYKRSIASNTTS